METPIKKGQVIRSNRTGKEFVIKKATENFVNFESTDGVTKQVLPKSSLWRFYTLKEN